MPLLPPRPRLEAARAWWLGGLVAASPFAFALGLAMGFVVAQTLWVTSLLLGIQLARPVIRNVHVEKAIVRSLVVATYLPLASLIGVVAWTSTRGDLWMFAEGELASIVIFAGQVLVGLAGVAALWYVLKRRGTPIEYRAYRVLVLGAVPMLLLSPVLGQGFLVFLLGLGGVLALGAGWLRILRPRQEVPQESILPVAEPSQGMPTFQAYRFR